VRILIADDQRRTRQGLKALLSASLRGAEIWEAANGVEALRLTEDVHPHLVLMDIRMPEMDGLAATRGIKSHWPDIKVLVLSLYEGRQEEARAAGADLFVSKGESPGRLLRALSSLLSRRRTRHRSSGPPRAGGDRLTII
jgi:DNA-binding NarL/FixJ family response regulator